jgi:hypothetical protein
MKLDQVQMVRAQTAQTSLDAFQQGTTRPVFAPDPARMTAFRKQVVVTAPFADRLSDEFFAAFIAFAGVDDIQSGIERAFEQASDSFLVCSFKADLGSAESKDRYLHIGVSKLPLFHF